MGSSVKSDCSSCGYTTTHSVGGSTASFKTHSYFPYHCSVCGFVSVNFADKPPVCPNKQSHQLICIADSLSEQYAKERAELEAYAQRRISFLERIGLKVAMPAPASGPNPVCQAWDKVLYDKPYQCPKCRQYAVRFKSTGVLSD